MFGSLTNFCIACMTMGLGISAQAESALRQDFKTSIRNRYKQKTQPDP